MLSYENALRSLESVNIPIYCIPDNHDDEKNLSHIFEGSKVSLITDYISTDYWDFHYVKISNLKTQLAKTDKNVVIKTHHHPFPVRTPLVDNCMIFNSDEFINTLDEKKKVRLVMCGHVHGDYIIARNHSTLETSPATYFQWMKSSKTTINKNGYKVFCFSPESYKSECIFFWAEWIPLTWDTCFFVYSFLLSKLTNFLVNSRPEKKPVQYAM